MQPIITSLLDTDLYKFTMMQCVFHHFPKADAEYRFICRKPVDLNNLTAIIQEQIAQFCSLQLTEDELQYLEQLPYFKKDFINYLKNFKLNSKYIHIQKEDKFSLIIQGPWLETILFEVPLLAIICETYYHSVVPHPDYSIGRKNLHNKIEIIKQKGDGIRFTDFGTRRRFSKFFHDEIIKTLKEAIPESFVGTSNVYFAKKYQLPVIGTMAHEYLQACEVLAPDINHFQEFALRTWLDEYPEHLKIALTDVLTMDVFLRAFNATLAKEYDGLRQDSGDPIEWGEKALAHYHKLNINPLEKKFVFSNGLTFPKMIEIYNHFKKITQVNFGIGTNLTNDVGYQALDIVIKMTQTNHLPVVKITDSKGKAVYTDEKRAQDLRSLFSIQE